MFDFFMRIQNAAIKPEVKKIYEPISLGHHADAAE
jgi:hypothetical protein